MSRADLVRLVHANLLTALEPQTPQQAWVRFQEAKVYFDKLSQEIWHDYIEELAVTRKRDWP